MRRSHTCNAKELRPAASIRAMSSWLRCTLPACRYCLRRSADLDVLRAR
jgi:hypothetical protein